MIEDLDELVASLDGRQTEKLFKLIHDEEQSTRRLWMGGQNRPPDRAWIVAQRLRNGVGIGQVTVVAGIGRNRERERLDGRFTRNERRKAEPAASTTHRRNKAGAHKR